MRKMLCVACLAGALAVADVVATGVYVYKNPNSLIGRCAAAGFAFTTQFNPFLYGFQTVSVGVANAMTQVSAPAASPAEGKACAVAEEPVAGEEEVIEPAPIPVVHGVIELPLPSWNDVKDEAEEAAWVEAPVVSTPEPPLVDPEVVPASGVEGGYVLPACSVAMPEDCSSSWFADIVKMCKAAAQAQAEQRLSAIWFSFFSSPSMLENKGDVEMSEPVMPEESQQDPNESYHHSECPYSGACPYTGRMPSYTPPAAPTYTPEEEKTEPTKLPKKKMKMPVIDDSEESDTPSHPEVDTMEFRKSDRTWDDYGPPMQM